MLAPTREDDFQGSGPPKMRAKRVEKRALKKRHEKHAFFMIFGTPKRPQKSLGAEKKNWAFFFRSEILKKAILKFGGFPFLALEGVWVKSRSSGRDFIRFWPPKRRFWHAFPCPELAKNQPGTRHATDSCSRMAGTKRGRRYSPQGGFQLNNPSHSARSCQAF